MLQRLIAWEQLIISAKIVEKLFQIKIPRKLSLVSDPDKYILHRFTSPQTQHDISLESHWDDSFTDGPGHFLFWVFGGNSNDLLRLRFKVY